MPFFGTNPFAFGAPRAGDEPLVVDMATASTARVNLVKAAAEGREIEPGHAIDSEGNPTTCLLYTSPSPRDGLLSRMPSSA